MLLTQRAAFGDMQGYLGLTATELPNADATAILLKAFHEMYRLFEKGGLTFDDTDAKAQAIQLEAEVLLGCYFFYHEYAPKKLLKDFETYGRGLGPTLDLGPFKIGEKGFSKKELGGWYREQAQICRNLYNVKLNTLLAGETKMEVESNYR